ncbi:MAG: DUF4914 family protein [Lachnospiraceae bacterium]|nr:DUF4914 family protein [Candidatus Minthocola equi]
MLTQSFFDKFNIDPALMDVLKKSKRVCFPETSDELRELCYGPSHTDVYEVSYPIAGIGNVKEAEVVRCKNGPVVNFMEDYMRRRDPDCMRIGDDLPTDKPRFKDIYGYEFSKLREETYQWLSEQSLIVLPFKAGGPYFGYESLMICPMNAAFFALSLSEMQGFISIDDVKEGFTPRAIIYVAPPFRHTHFEGKQVVVHSRSENLHEVFAYNLYPGPSAKKGVFSILLDIGEHEGWITNHASAAMLETPYENEVVFMHEGASGGGKSEMLEEVQRTDDGRVLIGTHLISGESYYIHLGETCKIHPIADDMVLAHKDFVSDDGELMIVDAEAGWFLRMDGDTAYGNCPEYERISIHPKEPLESFNMEGVPGSTCLIWDHYKESTGKRCTNPRVIMPRDMLQEIIPGNTPVEVNIRSFGVRMPPSTIEKPDYGVMGMMQVVPISLAWAWRLISPRGYKNPSIADSNAGSGLKAEGVGSYWPFCTGKKVTQANMLLKQMLASPKTLNILIPNQHIGAYNVGFAGEWLTREYLSRRVGQVRMRHLTPARCPIFGYSLEEMKVDGQYIRQTFLRPELQSKLGFEGYDAGAKILTDFFKEQIPQFMTDELDPLGRQILELILNDAPLEEYLKITPLKNVR